MEEPLVSIIIVNYNGYAHLKENLDSLYNSKYKNFEIIFVDNNSQDGSVKFVEENYTKVKNCTIMYIYAQYLYSVRNIIIYD